MKWIVLLTFTLASGFAMAQSKVLSCASLLGPQLGNHLPQEANETPLFELGLFRGVFAPAPGEKSWRVAAPVRGQGGDFGARQKIQAEGVSERLNGLYDDLDRSRMVGIYAFKKIGVGEVREYLDRVQKSNEAYAQSVKALSKSPLVLQPLAVRMMSYLERRTENDVNLMAHLNFIDRWVSQDAASLERVKPYSYYSQNLEMPRSVFRELVAAAGDRERVNALAKGRVALEKDKGDMVKVFLDQMFFIENGVPTLVSYVRERRELPQEISRRGGGGGERVLELQPEAEAQMELVPVPIRVPRGDRR